MKTIKKMMWGALVCVGLTGCATTPNECQPPCDAKLEPAPIAASGKYGAQTPNSKANSAEIPQHRVVYFDFDVSDVRQDQRQILEANASYLSKNQSLKVRLEGHADERGSREYNLALGERRAQSVKRYLSMMGVSEIQINTLSYGEEKPVSEAHDESSWQRNRRVEIVYLGE